MNICIALPSRLDIESTRILWTALQAKKGTPVTVDCSAVSQVGALAAQVLLVAARKWHRENIPFLMSGNRMGLAEGLALLGLNISMLSESDAT
jgi:anti-anti-sigma regulatory factor